MTCVHKIAKKVLRKTYHKCTVLSVNDVILIVKEMSTFFSLTEKFRIYFASINLCDFILRQINARNVISFVSDVNIVLKGLFQKRIDESTLAIKKKRKRLYTSFHIKLLILFFVYCIILSNINIYHLVINNYFFDFRITV